MRTQPESHTADAGGVESLIAVEWWWCSPELQVYCRRTTLATCIQLSRVCKVSKYSTRICIIQCSYSSRKRGALPNERSHSNMQSIRGACTEGPGGRIPVLNLLCTPQRAGRGWGWQSDIGMVVIPASLPYINIHRSCIHRAFVRPAVVRSVSFFDSFLSGHVCGFCISLFMYTTTHPATLRPSGIAKRAGEAVELVL